MSTDALPAAATHDDQDADDAARIEGRRALDAAIVAMARAAGAAVAERPVTPGLASMMPCPDPAAGIRFALMLRDGAERKVGEYITRARQDGLSWQQVGRALGLPGADEWGQTAAGAAFAYAAEPRRSQRFDRLSFAWMCPACREVVVDYGPDAGHPEDCEPGHAEGCGRLAAAVAAWRAQPAGEG